MHSSEHRWVAWTCRYTPLPLIHAAGLVPYRVLPDERAPDQAGTVLHDNMCPHVKRVLDRVLARDLPELTGAVIVASCDAMRRLADAWTAVRPDVPVHVVDLPTGARDPDVEHFADQLGDLRQTLERWAGAHVDDDVIAVSAQLYGRLAMRLTRLAEAAAAGRLAGGWRRLQELRERSVTTPPEEALAVLEGEPINGDGGALGGVPLYLFGNVLPDPQAFALIESCGARLVGDDLCTGSRQLVGYRPAAGGDAVRVLAEQILDAPPCARTVESSRPGSLAELVASRAEACCARGVVAHVMKFCDPYLARLPALRQALRDAGLPLLVLEGDCTLRSLGQQRTRIEAFVEMLAGGEA